jgi:sigma-E factor negative regulatory protein RseB
MDVRSRPAVSGLGPGTDPAALWVITAAVVAGLVMAGLTGVLRGAQAGDGQAGNGQAFINAAADRAGPGGPVPASQGMGVRLLTDAAAACRSVAFQGVETMDWWGPAGQASAAVSVWHTPGGQILARGTDGATLTLGLPRHLVSPEDGSVLPEGNGQMLSGDGMLGMSQRLVTLLAANYRLAVSGYGEVAGRVARIVSLRRDDGSLAARFWLDKVTALPLRRQMLDSRGQVVSDVSFARLTLGRGAVTAMPGAGAKPWGDRLSQAQLARLRASGWPLPGPLPGRFTLLGAREDTATGGPIVDLDYSDGLSVISVFVQPGHLPARLRGWSRVSLRGCRVYADDAGDHSVAWTARGFVYTLVAAAPPQTISQVVEALPHDGGHGFLARIGRGLHKLLSWMSP